MTTFQGRLPMMVPMVFDPADFAGEELAKVPAPPEHDRRAYPNRRAWRAALARSRKGGA